MILEEGREVRREHREMETSMNAKGCPFFSVVVGKKMRINVDVTKFDGDGGRWG